MSQQSVSEKKYNPLMAKILAMLFGGMVLYLFAILGTIGLFNSLYSGRILPGISVSGISLSGLPTAQAASKLIDQFTFPITGKILFRYGGQIWVASPAELGLIIDPGGSADAAFEVGRSGGMFSRLADQVHSLRNGKDIPPVIVFDQKLAYAYLQKIAASIDKPVLDASLSLEGVLVRSQAGQVGRLLNVDETMKALTSQLLTFSDGEIPLVVDEIQPAVADASLRAGELQTLLSQPLVLISPQAGSTSQGPWSLDPTLLAKMIKIDLVHDGNQAHYELSFYDDQLTTYLKKIASEIQRDPENARFIFNDDTRQLNLIKNAVIGVKLDLGESIKQVEKGAMEGKHEIPLVTTLQPPQVGDDAQGQTLGITELVSSTSTYFRGSSDQRIQNIQTASSRFHGLLVAPGETFSMGNALGDVSLENGYAEALIIYDNRTITGVGGGVCQVSTTLFRTVFFGGFPIVERHPHAYRVGYYEQTAGGHDSSLAGLDATVYVPLVDFKFTNDTPYWLLMETYVNVASRRLTWKFYSTKDGRTVQWNTSGPQNVIPAPDPLFQENPDLGTFEMKQVDYSADGAVVTVNRTVLKNGQFYFNDVFKTAYSPWQAICEYGSGVEDPLAKAASMGLCQP